MRRQQRMYCYALARLTRDCRRSKPYQQWHLWCARPSMPALQLTSSTAPGWKRGLGGDRLLAEAAEASVDAEQLAPVSLSATCQPQHMNVSLLGEIERFSTSAGLT